MATVASKKDRLDHTYSPDARKSRDIVKLLNTDYLIMIAKEIVKVLSDQTLRIRLDEAIERFVVANANYCREQMLPDKLVSWMGPVNGMMPDISTVPGAPAHKIELAAAWNELLICVNLATVCGVQKVHRFRPIELLAPDLDNVMLDTTSVSMHGSKPEIRWD